MSPRHHVATILETAEFELNAAELSDGSERESDDDCSASTNSLSSDDDRKSAAAKRTRPHTHPAKKDARLRDSLDLSMSLSVADMLPRPRKNEKPTKMGANVPKADPVPLKANVQEGADRKDAASKANHQPSGPVGATQGGDDESDLWTSKLVQRRRQLEKAATLAKEDPVNAVDTEPHQHTPSHFQVHPTSRETTTADPAAKAHDKQPSKPGPAAAQSSLKPPERYRSNGGAQTAAPIPGAHPSTFAPAKRLDDRAGVGVRDTGKVVTMAKPPACVSTAPQVVLPTQVPEHRNPSRQQGSRHVQFEPEEDDLLSAEEEKLRQSLANLDTRLIKLNTKSSASSVSAVTQHPSGRQIGTPGGNDQDDGDDDAMRAASYGGGNHCKRGQPTSASERASYAKRAEMSSGLHKLRVRVGGALAQEGTSNNANLEKGGKHKVVVKKDLAHLLF